MGERESIGSVPGWQLLRPAYPAGEEPDDREIIGYRERYVGLGTCVYQIIYRGDLYRRGLRSDVGDWIRESEYEALQRKG